MFSGLIRSSHAARRRAPVAVRSFWWKGDGSDAPPSSSSSGDVADFAREPKVQDADGSSDASSSSSGIARVGEGDDAPRFPRVVALPTTRPLFPGFVHPMTLTDAATIEAVLKGRDEGTPYVGMFLQRDVVDSPHGDGDADASLLLDSTQLHSVGTFAQVLPNVTETMAGTQVLLLAHRRLEITTPAFGGPPLHVDVNHLSPEPYDQNSDVVRAYTNEIMSTLKDVIASNPMFKEHLQFFMQRFSLQDPARLADVAASLTTQPAELLQEVLEAKDIVQRLELALVLLKKEREFAKVQREISQQVEEKMSKNQRNYFLQEQLKSIKKELGVEKDDKDALLQEFRERIAREEVTVPKHAQKVIEEEMQKLSFLEKNSSEFNVTRSYLDWLSAIPWGKVSDDNLDVARAEKVLAEDHHGLEDVKERILEFIAVGKLRGTIEGKILCMVGPPGVGKTSIGKSIAHAIEREFYRFSVGGLSDVSEIKGHRRTYVGAMPGKLVQCLKTTDVVNPVILIDEIDKLSRGGSQGGDPASALLELLDPSQNSTFVDHYLDVPIDLSKVLFVCTANDTSTIPGPLLDRMEIIRLSGYDMPEKLAIARSYLEPRCRESNGLSIESEGEGESDAALDDDDIAAASSTSGSTSSDATSSIAIPPNVRIAESAMESLIKWYCRESGVRNLEKHIDKLYRKVALRLCRAEGGVETKAEDTTVEGEGEASSAAFGEENGWEIGERELLKFLGKPPFQSDVLWGPTRLRETDSDAENTSPFATLARASSASLGPAPPGVTMGLAWTSMGGSTLYVECTPVRRGGKGAGSVRVTGQLGDVMQESVKIAHSFARGWISRVENVADAAGEEEEKTTKKTPPQSVGAVPRTRLDFALLDREFFEEEEIHVHVPEGATPKDGPSAGVTMVTSMLSAAMGVPVRPHLGMTGELCLSGLVLPIGGLKEKTIAARRSDVDTLIFPAANRRDFEELPEYLKEGLSVHFARTFDDVFAVAFPGIVAGGGEVEQ